MFARLLTEQMEANKSYPASFSDVTSAHWAANYIGYMEQFGIVRGYSDGTFRPNAPITRAEFAAICCRFEQLTDGAATFTDVPASHWAAKSIAYAAKRGWVTGYADGTFKPGNNITRAEVAAVTCRLLERSADICTDGSAHAYGNADANGSAHAYGNADAFARAYGNAYTLA